MELIDLKRGQLISHKNDDGKIEQNLYVITHILERGRGFRLIFQHILSGRESQLTFSTFKSRFKIISDPIDRRRLFKKPVPCQHCEEIISGYGICQICNEQLTNNCGECHLETKHGKILMVINKPVCGNLTPHTEEDAKYFPVAPIDRWF